MKRVLCLHGYTQSGPLFARKASAIRKALAKAGYETDFISAPIPVTKEELDFEVEDGVDMRAWWVINERDPKYYKLDAAIATVKEAIEQKGPFDGILGFSQGAGLAAVVCQGIQKWVPSHPALKFCVLYSGFRLKPEEYQHYYDPKISTPTLHVMGTLDTIVSEERSQMLVDACENPQVLKHPGGHYVPSQKPLVATVMKFIQDTEAPVEEKKESEDWDEFDSIGKQ